LHESLNHKRNGESINSVPRDHQRNSRHLLYWTFVVFFFLPKL